MRLITLHLQEPYVKALDALVEKKLYPNRAEVIRFAIRDLLKKESNLHKRETRMVHIRQLRCWSCPSLTKNFSGNSHSCPRNVFRDGELFPEFFASKCSLYTEPKE